MQSIFDRITLRAEACRGTTEACRGDGLLGWGGADAERTGLAGEEQIFRFHRDRKFTDHTGSLLTTQRLTTQRLPTQGLSQSDGWSFLI